MAIGSVNYGGRSAYQRGPGWDNLQANMMGVNSLMQGLNSIQDAKRQQADDAVKTRLTNAYINSNGNPDAIKQEMIAIEAERQKAPGGLSGFLNNINPLGSYTGVTPFEQQLQNTFIGQGMVDPQQREMAKAQIDNTNARTTSTIGGESREAGLYPTIKEGRELSNTGARQDINIKGANFMPDLIARLLGIGGKAQDIYQNYKSFGPKLNAINADTERTKATTNYYNSKAGENQEDGGRTNSEKIRVQSKLIDTYEKEVNNTDKLAKEAKSKFEKAQEMYLLSTDEGGGKFTALRDLNAAKRDYTAAQEKNKAAMKKRDDAIKKLEGSSDKSTSELTDDMIESYITKANGDMNKAKELARQDGYEVK